MEEQARSPSSDDARLVREAVRGRVDAFDELVQRYQRRAVAVAYRLLNNRDDALEVVQDAFLKAYSRLDSLSKPGRFGSWLMTIVSNLALNRRRSRALRTMAPLEAEQGEEEGRGEMSRPDVHAVLPPDAATGAELEGLLCEAIDELPETQRQALVLFAIEKMPQKEVARLLGLSVEAVKWHVFTARKKLKDRFRDYL